MILTGLIPATESALVVFENHALGYGSATDLNHACGNNSRGSHER